MEQQVVLRLKKNDRLVVFVLGAATFPLFYMFILSLGHNAGVIKPNFPFTITFGVLMVGVFFGMVFIFKKVQGWIAAVACSLLSTFCFVIIWLVVLRICGAYSSLW